MKKQQKTPLLPGIKGPTERKYTVTIMLTKAQSNAIHKIRTEQFRDMVPFATLVASLVADGLKAEQRKDQVCKQ